MNVHNSSPYLTCTIMIIIILLILIQNPFILIDVSWI